MMVLILKRFRKRGHGFKSHSTDWEKPGIKPGPPGLQDTCYRDVIVLFVVVFLGYNQYEPGGFMFFVVLCTGDIILVCDRVPWLY